MRHHVFISAFLVSVSLVLVAHAAELRTVAVTGQQAPGTDSGVTYDTFDAHYSGRSVFVFRGPVLNDDGQVAFRANVTGGGVNWACCSSRICAAVARNWRLAAARLVALGRGTCA